MKFLFLIFQLLVVVQAATTTSTSKTLVWATGTNEAGELATTQSPYTQTFTTLYSETDTPSSGEIGMGSLSGKVGQIRSYDKTTITQANMGVSFKTGAKVIGHVPFITKMMIGSIISTLIFTILI